MMNMLAIGIPEHSSDGNILLPSSQYLIGQLKADMLCSVPE